MKVTLKASNEAHRQIARLFIGQEVQCGRPNILQGVTPKNLFAIYTEFQTVEQVYTITISLDTPMDLRLALGTDIEFEEFDEHSGLWLIGLDDADLFECWTNKVKTKISTSYLERVGAKVEDV